MSLFSGIQGQPQPQPMQPMPQMIDIGQPPGSQSTFVKQRTNETLLMYEHSFEDLLTELENKFKGYVWHSGSEKWIKRYPALLNDEGVNSLMLILNVRVSKLQVLSNYNEDEINEMLWSLTRDLILLLFMKAEEWETDTAYCSTIVNLVQDSVRAIYHRALGAGERDMMRDTTELREIRGEQGKEKKRWGFLPF